VGKKLSLFQADIWVGGLAQMYNNVVDEMLLVGVRELVPLPGDVVSKQGREQEL